MHILVVALQQLLTGNLFAIAKFLGHILYFNHNDEVMDLNRNYDYH